MEALSLRATLLASVCGFHQIVRAGLRNEWLHRQTTAGTCDDRKCHGRRHRPHSPPCRSLGQQKTAGNAANSNQAPRYSGAGQWSKQTVTFSAAGRAWATGVHGGPKIVGDAVVQLFAFSLGLLLLLSNPPRSPRMALTGPAIEYAVSRNGPERLDFASEGRRARTVLAACIAFRHELCAFRISAMMHCTVSILWQTRLLELWGI
jgi:hypothetical protein